MKKRITGILLIFYIIIPIIIAVPAMAAESGVCGDNLTWILDDSGTLTINGTGNMTDWSYTQYSPWHDNSDNIKAIIIENGVTSIGNLAFTNCGNMASVVLPDSLTSIGNSAFEHCISLSTVKIPDNVTNIGNSAFWFCNGLTDIIIGNKLARIDDGTFTGCQSLSSINIPDNVTGIGSSAFAQCQNLTDINIGNGVTDIGNTAFVGCKSLANIKIPKNITNIGFKAFSSCSSLINIDVDNNNPNYSSIDGNLFNKSKTILIQYATGKKDTSFVIPDSVTKIGNSAFSGCGALINISIPEGVTNIDKYSFASCENLTSITIPGSVTSIGSHAFFNCSNLADIKICYGATDIGSNAFSNCDTLESITIPNSVINIGGEAFSHCDNLTTVTMSDNLTNICDRAFYGCIKLTNINIPNSVTSIGDSAFENCCVLTSFTIPNRLTSIGNKAFYDCIKLTNINIPDSIMSIGSSAFENCRSLTIISIPDSLISIGDSAFSYCTKLKTIIIPNSVTEIEADAFYECPVKFVFYRGTEKEWNEIYIAYGNDYLAESKIIFNAKEKTYHFVTNCSYSLPDITGYIILSAPVAENDGKILTGWYDNRDLNGEPVTFPYFGDATTLYAAWADRTGASFDDAFPVTANSEYSVTTNKPHQMIYYEFIPEMTGEYRFYSKADIDTYGYLYNSSKQLLLSNDNGGDGRNFKLVYNLSAGKKYYIAAKCIGETGSFLLITETDCFKGTKTSCVTAVGGEKIFITVPSSLPENAQIILACYNNGELTEMNFSPNKNETLYFVTANEFDSVKVMVWESLDSMIPFCEPEIVK